MPLVILVVLILVVAPYVLLGGAAALGFMMARRRTGASAPSDEPTVSLLVSGPLPSVDDFLQRLLNSSYPEDRIEEIIQVHSDALDDASRPEASSIRVRSVQTQTPTSGGTRLDARFLRGLATARSEVLLATTAECEVPPNWIRSMVRRCTPTTPIVIGPTLVEHDDRFLPRLEAFQQVGAFAFAAGLQHFGVPFYYLAPNLAIRSAEGIDLKTEDDPVRLCEPREGRTVFNPEAEAAVRCSPAASFLEYLQRQARMVYSVTRRASWSLQTALAGLWVTHTVLLVCCFVAVAFPAWRQPTLLALFGKMGADALLSVPAARHFGQRTLTRSFVPSELLLVLSIPVAGVLSLFETFSPTEP